MTTGFVISGYSTTGEESMYPMHAIFYLILISQCVDGSHSSVPTSCQQNAVVFHGNGYTMCYWVTTDEYYPNAGNTKCKEDNGIIGEVLDLEAHEFLKCAIPPISKQSLWIGYNDIAVENQHINWNGDPMTWHFMHGGGPSDPYGTNDCMEWYVNVPEHVMWVWNDAPCTQDTYRVLCSKRMVGVEEVDRAYTRTIGQDFAYFYKITTNVYNELGSVIQKMDSTSDTGCLAKGCVLDSNCYSTYYNSSTDVCMTFTCPKMNTDNTPYLPDGSEIWIVRNY